ncbi:S8 family serine peptidase [Chitinolyticbacter meiyuanensis]|uniref:S8 family serine peptidase n=1 Tax=Chitinolyticbacter meiyuanensis TaxID=682798 RepID=UPI001651EA48|nr:S8 family serine peptidase [Chitinolyticbacter meiyuanensis]
MVRFTRKAVVLAVLSASAWQAQADEVATTQHRLEDTTDRLIIKYRNQPLLRSQSVADLSASTESIGAARLGVSMRKLRDMHSGARVVKLDRRVKVERLRELARELAADDPNIEYVEADTLNYADATTNDPQLGSLWGFKDNSAGSNVQGAWDITTGKGVVVAVIDTGYRPHRDLVANILPGADLIADATRSNDGDGRDLDAADPGDYGTCDGAQRNSGWHGSHVAGTIAAVGNNGEGVVGVAYGARVVPVRVLGVCGGYTSDIADGMIWAAGGDVPGLARNANPAKVLNLSLGGTGSCGTTYQNAINYARSQGAVVVVSAGNDNVDVSTKRPASCAGVITVAATTSSGARASYSNFGSMVEIAAPGSSVLSTINTGTTSPVADGYGSKSGTSMAAPHVSGVAALMLSVNAKLTPDQIDQILRSTAKPMPVACPEGCGAGLMDARAAVAQAKALAGPTPTPAPTSVPTPTKVPTPTPTKAPTPVAPTPVSSSCYAAWSSSAVYTGGQRVTYNGRNYEAKWWTQSNVPASSIGEGKPWLDLGACGSSVPTATPQPTPTLTPRPTATPTPTPQPTAVPTLTPTPRPTSTPLPTAVPTATPTPVVTPVPSSCNAAWSADAIYIGGDRVTYNGVNYEAKWWTRGENPAQSGQWGVWKVLGNC